MNFFFVMYEEEKNQLNNRTERVKWNKGSEYNLFKYNL